MKLYPTFLNVSQLERQGADLQTKIEELQIIIHWEKNDKVKDDALAHYILSIIDSWWKDTQQLERKYFL